MGAEFLLVLLFLILVVAGSLWVTGYCPDQGLPTILTAVVGANLKLHLFSNNVTPSDSTVLADLTESTFTGYAAVTLSSGSWTDSGVTAHQDTFTYLAVTFTNSSGSNATVYGFYITDSGSTKLVGVALFDGSPITITASGGTYTFIPTLQAKSIN